MELKNIYGKNLTKEDLTKIVMGLQNKTTTLTSENNSLSERLEKAENTIRKLELEKSMALRDLKYSNDALDSAIVKLNHFKNAVMEHTGQLLVQISDAD